MTALPMGREPRPGVIWATVAGRQQGARFPIQSMSILDRFFSPKPPDAAEQFRAGRKRLIRAISTADTEEERIALAGQLHLMESERDVKTADKLAEQARHLGRGAVEVKAREGRASKAREALAKAMAGVARMLGFNAAPAPAAAQAPTQPSPNAGPVLSPFPTLPDRPSAADLGAFILALVQVNKPALAGLEGVDACHAEGRKLEVLGDIIKDVMAVDPSGKILERLESPTARERNEAARVMEPIIRRAMGAPGQAGDSLAVDGGLRGLDRVKAAFARDARPAPNTPAPKADSIVGKLTGVNRTAAAFREQAGLPPLPNHQAAAFAHDRLTKKD